MDKRKRKGLKRKYKQLNNNDPNFPKEKEVFYEIGEKIEYLDCHNIDKFWKKGTIESLSIRRRDLIVFNIMDNFTKKILPVNKHLLRKLK